MLRSLLLPLCLFTLPGFAQMVYKCCGSQNNTFLLGNTNYARHSQCLYLPGDFQNNSAGTITRLYYRYGTTGTDVDQTLTEFRIGLLQNTATTFSNMLFFTGLTPAKNAAVYTIAAGTAGEWLAIDLDQPFVYDPTLSLIIDISFETSTTMNFGTLSTSMPGRKLYWSDTSSPTGSANVANVQDVGFDLGLPTMIPRQEPMITAMWPNPATDRLFLHLDPANGGNMVDVLDASGRTVLPSRLVNNTDHTIDLAHLGTGLYLLRIQGADGDMETHRFLRQ